MAAWAGPKAIPAIAVPASAAPVTNMTVWVKEKGAWKVRADMGNTHPKP
jgi:hypothetical protein